MFEATSPEKKSPEPSPSLKPEPMQPGEAVDFGSSEHLDGLIAEAEATEAVQEATDSAQVSPENSAGRLTTDQFFMAFRGVIQAPNFVMKPPLKSLEIDEGDQAARAASDAIYETCADVPWLNFLIEPGNVWAGRAIVVGAFAFGMTTAVRSELAERRKDRARMPQDEQGPGSVADEPGAAVPARPARPAPRPVMVDGEEYSGVLNATG